VAWFGAPVLALALCLIEAPRSLEAQWLDSLRALPMESPASMAPAAFEPPGAVLPDTIVRPPHGRLQWAIVGALLGGTVAWCSWDSFCQGGNSAARSTFSVSGAAVGAVIGALLGDRVFGRDSTSVADP
jgi:hypothetical protein